MRIEGIRAMYGSFFSDRQSWLKSKLMCNCVQRLESSALKAAHYVTTAGETGFK
jgi:hypothetical protein